MQGTSHAGAMGTLPLSIYLSPLPTHAIIVPHTKRYYVLLTYSIPPAGSSSSEDVLSAFAAASRQRASGISARIFISSTLDRMGSLPRRVASSCALPCGRDALLYPNGLSAATRACPPE